MISNHRNKDEAATKVCESYALIGGARKEGDRC